MRQQKRSKLGRTSAKLERDRVGTVSFVGGVLVAFVVENVANVASTSSAADLSALHAHGDVRMKSESTLDGLEEGRPAATGVEFGFAFIKRRVAASAVVDALFVVLIVLA